MREGRVETIDSARNVTRGEGTGARVERGK